MFELLFLQFYNEHGKQYLTVCNTSSKLLDNYKRWRAHEVREHRYGQIGGNNPDVSKTRIINCNKQNKLSLEQILQMQNLDLLRGSVRFAVLRFRKVLFLILFD